MSIDKLNRRNFIKKSALAAALCTFGSQLKVSRAAAKKILLTKISGSSVPADLDLAVKKVLKPLGGMKAFVKEGQSVVLKPNMCVPAPPGQRATTSPELVAAVARQVLECGAKKVLVVDFPVRSPKACLKENGIQAALKDLGVKVLMPHKINDYVEIPIPKGKTLTKTKVMRIVQDADVQIALPVAKSHMAAKFSGVMKGMMGLIWDRRSFHSIYDMNQAIVDLNTVLKAELIILDGLQVMTTDGPVGPGELVTCNSLIAGLDPVAVDSAGVQLAPLYGRQIKPRQVKQLKSGQAAGLGRMSPPDDQVVKLLV
ncbi:MAG: DUF362 domain-containing protein [Deltaproteobacteria bacterium]|nr:DUF362 domain-containing protein [Deltaproteobacteria bacterium]MBW1873276.1 DUF362 domain-containing protein [Deltaproteobacteria bacterium]